MPGGPRCGWSSTSGSRRATSASRYWLYVVFGCATPSPQLYRVQDPFRNLLASEHAATAFTITVGNIVKAADTEAPSYGRSQ